MKGKIYKPPKITRTLYFLNRQGPGVTKNSHYHFGKMGVIIFIKYQANSVKGKNKWQDRHKPPQKQYDDAKRIVFSEVFKSTIK